MLKNEVGLDIETLSNALDPTVPDSTPPLSTPPKRLLPGTRHLDRPDYTARSHSPSKTAITLEQLRQKSVAGFTTKGEAREVLDDAVSLIYDQFKAGLLWRSVWRATDWFPCEFLPSPSEAELMRSQKGLLKSHTLSWKARTASGPTN